MKPVYILGGTQSDFARNIGREGNDLFELFREVVADALTDARTEASDIGVCHVGNFVSDLFTGQAHLGGFFAEAEAGFRGTPTARHEAACASGSIALLAALTDIQSGHYETSCVLGIEQMRNVSGMEAAEHLSAAAWRGREHTDANYLWPAQFSDLTELYMTHRGLKRDWLREISANAFINGKKNPLAQTRHWDIGEPQLSNNDATNPLIEGVLRKQDCGQVSDGAAAVVLASENAARDWAVRNNKRLENIPRIAGWGHTGAPMRLSQKTENIKQNEPVFPHVTKAFHDCLSRASLKHASEIQGIELHDCFSITGYMLLDHMGLEAPGEAWRILERGISPKDGLAVNPSGGLIGLGHPVGATGVRMLYDAYRQVNGTAGEIQVDGAKHFATLNVGGSATTVVSFLVTR